MGVKYISVTINTYQYIVDNTILLNRTLRIPPKNKMLIVSLPSCLCD